MSRFQTVAVIVAGLLCALDGFDVLAITYAAPALRGEWGISNAQMGYALSAGLLGMALGSLLLSPLADAFGRRRMLFVALVLMVAGTFWTALAGGIPSLIASRVMTGLGIGAMVGVISPLAAEYANARRRDLAVSLAMTSFGFGAFAGGLISAWLLAWLGWRSIFFLAGGLGLVMILVVRYFLLDPLALIVARPGKDGVARANEYLRRCGHPAIASLPPPPIVPKVPFASLFKPPTIRDTMTLTAIYFFYMVPLFYLQTWLPTLVVDIGLQPAHAAAVSAFQSIGGVCAGIFVATTSLRIGLKRLELMLLGGAAVMIVIFAMLPGNLPLLTIGATLAGFFVGGAQVGLWAIIARTFPAHLRASGTGFVIGIGRLGSILPPILAGILFTAGYGRINVSLLMAVPALLSLTLLLTFRVRPPTIA